ncbi:MAG: cytoskeletal protein RodZ [Pelotomaculum sp. PtaU1.Bin035]|nr:MAG: cytoskeletal protein RodZ [Pelotomaculum sp. PtaU1.Bin035]
MTRRDFFITGSLIFLGIIILIGAYLWQGNNASSKEIENIKQTYAKQAEELQKEEKNTNTPQTNQANTKSGNSTQPASNPTTPAATGSVPNSPSNPALSAEAKINSLTASGCKVGDTIKFGDVEMVVTKSPSKHKVIVITLKGNTADQPPQLITSGNNRIIYEIPADVDVNVDVTEKIKS